MFERMKNSKLAYVIVFLTCLNGVVGCYKPRIWDAKYYKYQPTFQDRAVARSMVMDKDVLIDNSFKEIETLIDDKALSDENKKASMKNAMRAMVNEKDKKERKIDIVSKCLGDISGYIKLDMPISEVKNKDKVKNALEGLVDKAVKHEEKKYTVNGMEFQVKDNCIYFSKLDVSVPLTDIKVSDADVIGFSSDIQKALRWRMDTARRVRLGSGTAQILAASAGATLGFVTKDVTTAAALAAFSAVIPELQNIFQARDRSGAYQQGLELIQDAEARYYQNRTANGTSIETVSTNRLTKEGGELLVQISACLKLVDKALFQTIPTIADLQAATGRLEEALGQIKVVPASLNVGVNGTQSVQIINSKAITYAVSNAAIVEVLNFNPDKPTEKIEIKGIKEGSAKVTVYNALGHSGYCDVTVDEVKKFEIQTGSATEVKETTAKVDGVIITDYPSQEVWFKYGTKGNINFKKVVGVLSDITGVKQLDKIEIDGLSPGTEYYFMLVGSSTAGIREGRVESFTTSKVETEEADAISEIVATLNGKVITQNKIKEYWFMYGVASGKCDQRIDIVTDDVRPIDKLGSPKGFEITKKFTDFKKGTLYHYKLFAKDDADVQMDGGEKSFVTKGTSAQIGEPTNLGANTVTLNGTVITDLSSIKVWFEYSMDEKYETHSQEVLLKEKAVNKPVSIDVKDLTSDKTYNYRIKVADTNGKEISLDANPKKFTTK